MNIKSPQLRKWAARGFLAALAFATLFVAVSEWGWPDTVGFVAQLFVAGTLLFLVLFAVKEA